MASFCFFFITIPIHYIMFVKFIDEKQNIRTFVGDICEPKTVVDAFKGVDTVFHCAALVSLRYPPNYKELDRVNVDGK